MFQSGSLIVFTSTFWVLRVRESSPLRRRHLMLVSGCDDHNGTQNSPGGTEPMNFTPKISEPTAYFANDRVFLWHGTFNRVKHTAGTWWKRALSCGRNPSAARAADSHHALHQIRQSQANEAAANLRTLDFGVLPLENNYFPGRCCPTHGNPHWGGSEGDSLSTTTLGSGFTKSFSKLDEAYPNPLVHFSTGVHLPAQTHSSLAAEKPSSNQAPSA
ncbi:hypothetical protein IWQ60_007315 [Tieghemiomyces parasiticus]|uniref:Uncharacterized protein n=1 Tax=Tieghemiomyces parasiticus TaxID=78921 RepID=A0A9W8A371_9FUNG|nr:hypothetical protein IWQ60_007315 [Tieghemiomyces parasiticus]